MRDREVENLWGDICFFFQLEKHVGKNMAVNQKHKIDILYVLTTKLLAYHLIFCFGGFWFRKEKQLFVTLFCYFFSNDPSTNHWFAFNPKKRPADAKVFSDGPLTRRLNVR